MLASLLILLSLAAAGKTWQDLSQQIFKNGVNDSAYDPLHSAGVEAFVQQLMHDFHTP